jgi:hypothetical protein
MVGVTVTDEGLEWIGDKSLVPEDTNRNLEEEYIQYVAIGTGSTDPDPSNSQLNNEIHRQKGEFTETDGTGGFDAVITVSGGTEVEPGQEVNEIGIFAGTENEEGTNQGTLILHEVISGVVVEAGHREQFTIPLDFSR